MRIAPFALSLAVLLALAGCSDDRSKKKAVPAPVPVTTAKAVEKDIPVVLQVVGRAEAYESVVLKPRIDGQVASVLFTEGQHVKQGDVLIQLDPTDFAARLQQAQAAVARDEALVAKSRADTARYTALKNRNFVSEEKVNDTRTNESAAAANLRASQAAAQVIRLQLSYATIRSPITGVVGARLVFPGSAVKVNETTLAVVNKIRPLLVTFSIPEKHLARLRTAVKGGEMKVQVSLPSDKSQTVAGKVIFLDNAVDAATGTILMKASLPNTEEKLTPGQFLNVAVILNVLEKAVTIPNVALQQGADGNFVYVVKEDSTVDMRKVEVASTSEGFTAISKGLALGDTVVTDGHLRLTPGVKIRKKDASDEKTEKAEKAEKSETTVPKAQ